MANYQKASDDVVALFDRIVENTTIPNWIKFEVLCNNKQKELYKINRMNDLIEMLTDGLNFAVIINEEIFEQLPANLQEIALVECISGVSVSESDAVSLEKPNFSTHTGVLQKYGHEVVIQLKESVISLYDQKKQKEDEAKAQKKAKKLKKAF